MTTDRELAALARQAVDDLTEFIAELPRVRADWHTWATYGYRQTSSFEPHAAAGVSDPTADLALADRHERAVLLAQYEAIEADIRLIVDAANRLRQKQLVARLKRPTRGGAEGCTSCARLKDFWSPVYAAGLCRWCYDFVNDWGTRPHPRLVAEHRDGRQVRLSTIREWMPELRAKAEVRRRKAAGRRA